MLAARQQRVAPNLDDKIIAGWNGLAINALAEASWVLREPRYLQAAERAADFVLSEMVDDKDNLLRAYRAGRAQHSAVLEDYSYMMRARYLCFSASAKSRRIMATVSTKHSLKPALRRFLELCKRTIVFGAAII